MSDSKDPTSPFAPLDNKGWLDPMPRMDLSPGIDAKDAEITRLRVALAEKMVVKVKPLVWEPCEDWKVCSKERAPAFGGEYQMVLLDPKDDPRPSLYFEIGLGAFMFRFEQGEPDHLGPTGPKKFPTFAAAKAAAQADYTARILSAVDPDEITHLRAALADAQAVGFAAGVEAAAKRCDAIAGNTADFNHYHRRAAGQCGAAIRALTPPDATAAAARVLLADDAAAHALCAAFVNGLRERSIDTPPYDGWSQKDKDETAGFMQKGLLAIAGDTP